MKIQRTAPGNRAFFNEHGASLTAYGAIGLMGQILSGLSLAYAVYTLFVERAGSLPPAVLVTLAALVGLFIELGNRVLARRAIKPFVVKNPFEGEEAKRHRILTRSYLVGLVAVALLSYLFSAVGSVYYSDDATAPAVLVNTDSLQAVSEGRRAALTASFAADTAMVAGPYHVRAEAAKNRFKADSAALMQERRRFIPCANEGNAWCSNKLSSYLANIERSRAALADTLATVAREKSAALAIVLQERREQAARIDGSTTAALSSAERVNAERIRTREASTGFKGLIFIILTVAGQTVFYFMVYLTLQVEAGADIQRNIEPNEFWDRPSILQELSTTASWRIERGARRMLARIFPEPGDHATEIPYRGLYARARTQAVTQPQTEEQRKGEVGVTASCEACGDDYIRRTTRQRFCSDACRLEFHARKHNGRKYTDLLTAKKIKQ